MSINRKLGDLANVLDDGTEGQVLSFNASGVIAASDIAAGASVYDSAALLPLSGLSAGDMAYVTGTNRFYISNGTGWYSVSLINTNPSITSVQDSAGGTTPFTLTTDGTATVITVTASDPEDVPLTYNYSVTSGSLTNGGGTTATVTQADNVFTVTPSTTEAYAGTFELTFTASDGINQDTSANSFTLSFITIIANSNYTTLLATATGTSDNNNITDASTNNHSITVTGDTHAGTFSPYRSGGYSTYFDGTGDYIDTNSAINLSSGGCIEGWVYITSATNYAFFIASTQGAPNYPRWYVGHSNATDWRCSPGDSTDNNITSYDLITNQWNHFVLSNDGSRSRLFANGVLIFTKSVTPVNENLTFTLSKYGSSAQYFMTGNLFDVRVNTSIPTEYQTSSTTVGASIFTPPTEPLSSSGSALHICHLPYLADGSSNTYTLTPNGDVSTKPFSPYDYDEYSAADHGGSVFFEGGDYLTIADHNDFNLTSDFTIKFWARLNVPYAYSGNVTYGLFDNFSYNNGGVRVCINGSGLQNGKLVLYWNSAWDTVTAEQFNFIPEKNQWYYYELTRSSNTLTVKVNGESVGTVNVTNLTNPTTSLTIGTNTGVGTGQSSGTSNYNNYLYGYISDFQYITGGTASESSVPIAPMSTDTNSKLHLKGTDASIIDKSQVANLKLAGNTTGSTTQVKFSNTKSMYFDGTGDMTHSVLPVPLASQATIEFWMYSSATNKRYIFAIGLYGVSSVLGIDTGSGTFSVRGTSGTSGSTHQIIAGGAFSANTWYHVAIVRDGTTYELYVDGISKGTGTYGTATHYDSSYDVTIGSLSNNGTSATYPWSGYIQDFRITNGLARYTANFTPPSAPLEG